MCSTHISESMSVSLTQDGDWVWFMAQVNNATQIPSDELIAVILELSKELKHVSECPRPSSITLTARERFMKEIKNHISKQSCSYQGVLLQSMQGFQHGGYQHGTTIYVAFSLLAGYVNSIVALYLSSWFIVDLHAFKIQWKRTFLGRNNKILWSSWTWLRVSMSALMGDPDLYPQVYRLSKFKHKSMWVIRYRWLGSVGQVPMKIQVLVI